MQQGLHAKLQDVSRISSK